MRNMRWRIHRQVDSTLFNSLFSFYRSKEWEDLRSVLRMERVDSSGDIICGHCGRPIVNRYDCIAHHVIPLTESNVNNYDISLNPANIELVHHSCHNDIHNRFGSYTRHIYIVYGSPCSGKSTYVNRAALQDDLIIDIDRIYEAMCNGRSNRLYPNVMAVYRQLIDMVKTRNGQWVNAWIVRGFPLKGERERLAKELNAELVFIDTDRQTCLDRSRLKGKDYYRHVDDWWEKFQA